MPRNTFVEGLPPYPGEYPESYSGRKETKARALMQVISKIMDQHPRGPVGFSEPTLELFELAKRIYNARNEKELDSILKVADFDK